MRMISVCAALVLSLALLQAANLRGAQAAVHPGTNTDAPLDIQVLIRTNGVDGKPDPNGAVIGVDDVTWYDRTGNSDYLQNVLPVEWVCAWPAESLKAGAIAVKMYGWYHTMNPKYPANGADVDNSTNSQVYIPGSADNASCTSAIRAVDGVGFRKFFVNDLGQRFGYVFETLYCSGSYRDDRNDPPCPPFSQGTALSQNGSHFFADPRSRSSTT